MGDKVIQGKALLIRDVFYLCTMLIGWTTTYMTTAHTADSALELARENKAYGMAREKKITEVERTSKEYARDYSYRKDSEIIQDVKSNTEEIHAIREGDVETRVKMSHLEKNQEKMLQILEDLKRK